MTRDTPVWLRLGSLVVGLLFLVLPLPAPFDTLRPPMLA